MRLSFKSESGTILGIALVYFLVFSITGLGVIALSGSDRVRTENSVRKTMNYHHAESLISQSLWRVSISGASNGNISGESGTATLDSTTNTLTIVTAKDDTLTVTTVSDNPFNYIYSYSYRHEDHCWWMCPHFCNGHDHDNEDDSDADHPDPHEHEDDDHEHFDDDDNDGCYEPIPNIAFSDDHSPQPWDELPEPDEQWFRDHATEVYANCSVTYRDTIPPGIHFIEKSGKVILKNQSYLRGTFFVKGNLKILGTGVRIDAGTDSSGTLLPALLVEGPDSKIWGSPNLIVNGAIWSNQHLFIKGGDFTGPLVAPSLVPNHKISLNDQGSDTYYTWPSGFGSVTDYDWPLSINEIVWN